MSSNLQIIRPTTRHRRPATCSCGLCQPATELMTRPADEALLTGRTLALFDLQNLFGGVDVPTSMALDIYRTLVGFLGLGPGDDIVVALSSRGAANLMTTLPLLQSRLVIGNGRHGACRALVEYIDVRHAASRYDNVVIASGDHTLTELAQQFRANGTYVCHVTSSLSFASHDLVAACHRRIRLEVCFPAEDAEWEAAA